MQNRAVLLVVDHAARRESYHLVVDLKQWERMLLADHLSELAVGRKQPRQLREARRGDQKRQHTGPQRLTHPLTLPR